MKRLLFVLLLLAIPAYSQSWDEMAKGQTLVFDKVLSGTDKMIFIQPPPGKTWVILEASLNLTQPVGDFGFMAWLEDHPSIDYRDPVTGVMRGCPLCITLIRLRAGSHVMFPIVGGYSETLRGQTMPIVLRHPRRLALMFTPEHGALPDAIPTWTRVQVVERDIN